MQVTHIITGLNVGGAERALFSLLAGGLLDGCSNRVISLTDEGYYGPLLRDAGVPLNCLSIGGSLPGPRDIVALSRLVRRHPADIIQGWMYHGNIAATLAAQLSRNRPALSWNVRQALDAKDEFKLSTRLVIRLGGWISKLPDAIIYNSDRASLQHESSGYHSRESVVIPNGFDACKWRPDPAARFRIKQSLKLGEQVRIIGFVGRGEAQKDLPNLFHAFARVAADIPDVVLVCVGRDLERWIPRGMSTERIRFLGQRTDAERIVPAFDLLCLSSRTEGFPNVVGEAMACGVPCVTTDVGDAAAIVAETGWSAPPRDSGALAAALQAALDVGPDERRARGFAARARIKKYYSLSSVMDRYQVLYAELANQNA